jgi:hypothetical protein
VRVSLPGLLALAVLVAGCGDEPGGSPTDKALACLEEEGLPARKTNPFVVQVGRPGVGPRVVLARSVSEAESTELADDAPDAEQIGRSLLYVNRASERELKTVELCLEELAR